MEPVQVMGITFGVISIVILGLIARFGVEKVGGVFVAIVEAPFKIMKSLFKQLLNDNPYRKNNRD